ncbi:MAG: oligoendopeptidase F [Bacillota bacterium]
MVDLPQSAAKPLAREQMDPASQWDLSDIFKDTGEWEGALKRAKEAIGRIPALKGTLGESAQALCKALDLYYDAARQAELVYTYAHLLMDGDNGNTAYQSMQDRGVRLMVEMETLGSFLTPELLSLPEERVAAFAADPLLKPYAHVLDDILRRREHTLDEEREKMLKMLGEVAEGPTQCFTMFESVDMRFPAVKDEAGNMVELTHANFSIFRESMNRSVRSEAFEKYFGEFDRFKNTLCAMYASSVKLDVYFAHARVYGGALEEALADDNVPVGVYHSLIDAVKNNLPKMEKYLDLRRQALGLGELYPYDLYCPMVKDVEYHLSFEEAKTLVLDALRPLGEPYCGVLRRAFNERWIDVYENKGKTTGAFSCGVYGVHPYVLLNFQGKLGDAFTLAHELGHAMHSYLSSEKQPYHDHEYSILAAEVASTVNEVLLQRYLLARETDPRKKAYLLNHFLEGFRTTLVRQTLFAEFEYEVHRMQQGEEPLTVDALNALYASLNAKYYKGVKDVPLNAIEWARIPHFYRAFYVYQYATGYSSAVAIADRILCTNDASDYLAFLSMGGSDYPLAELKRAGVDLESPAPVNDALAVFDQTIDQLKSLLEGIA